MFLGSSVKNAFKKSQIMYFTLLSMGARGGWENQVKLVSQTQQGLQLKTLFVCASAFNLLKIWLMTS
jgi:hypothetical protein